MNTTKRIILIDDEEVITFGFAQYLREPGIEIDCMNTFNDARQAIATGSYDAAVVDLRLSDSTEPEGLFCVELLRAHQSQCKIIVLTAYGDSLLREQAKARGADLFLEKPIEPQKLMEVLSSFGIYSS